MNTRTDTEKVEFPDRIEHHEVPEGRVIHGHNMSFLAPVYGELVSNGGKIHLQDLFGWGSANDPFGSIRSAKRAFNATLMAPGGDIEVVSAESCLIVGRRVRVESAVNCQIFADSLDMGAACGCIIASRNIQIQRSDALKLEPTTITMVVPDLPDIESELAPLRANIADLRQITGTLKDRIDAYKANPALSQYLSIRAKVKSGVSKLTDEQAQGFSVMEQHLEPTARELELAVSERRPQEKALSALVEELQSRLDAQTTILSDCYCKVMDVAGETILRMLVESYDSADLSLISQPKIPRILFRNDASVKFLQAARSGHIDWRACPP